MSEKHKGGRPRQLDRQKVMQAVCDRVARGELVKYAAIAEGTTAYTIREWALTKEFAPLYARARDAQAHALAEQALEIADGSDAITQLYEDAIEEEDDALRESGNKMRHPIIAALRANLLNRDRMRMDARKWLTSKIAPRYYGDKLELAGPGGGPVEVRVRIEREGRRITSS
jgi:hypothetical protein